MTWAKPPVVRTADFARVRDLPVRGPGFYPADLVQEMTRILKTPDGARTLFDVQARALYDFGMSGEMAHSRRYRGFYPIKVGGGKTLITLLLGRMMPCQRPALLLPASLILKTQRAIREEMQHWRVRKDLRLFSYQKIGRVGGDVDFNTYNPDLVILDECHFSKNPKAAVTRRIARFMAAHPQTAFVAMSGSIMKDSIADFAHLLAWSHGQHSPLPLHAEVLQEWAEALDEGLNPAARRSPGVLLDLYPTGEADPDPVRQARIAFEGRLNATLGIVSADAKNDFSGSLYVNALEYKPNAATSDNFQKLREEMTRPDGWALTEAMQAWAVARQLALGLHYAYDPPAPDDWLNARKQWARFVRDTLTHPRSERMGLDSELQVTNAVLSGHLEDPYGLLAEWQAIRPTFLPNSVPVWHDPTALQVAGDWLGDHSRGICWVEHRHFAKALSGITGLPYFGAKGLDAKGNFIEDASGPIIASIAANSTGRNLQHQWCDALVTAPPCDAERWEQLLARQHRPGQKADTVSVDVLVACREHLESVPRGLSSAEVKADLLGAKTMKLRIADLNWPSLDEPRHGSRWA